MHSTDRVIGFDFGLKRIGVAAGNVFTKTTQGLSPITAKNGIPDWTKIEKIISDWQPNRLVVGLPLKMDGLESEMCTAVRRFGQRLYNHTGVEVVFVDERLSSSAADALIRETVATGKSVSKRRIQSRDSLAAELILHTFIEENSTS